MGTARKVAEGITRKRTISDVSQGVDEFSYVAGNNMILCLIVSHIPCESSGNTPLHKSYIWLANFDDGKSWCLLGLRVCWSPVWCLWSIVVWNREHLALGLRLTFLR